MPRKAQPVSLTDDELRSLIVLTKRGATPAREQTRARILMLLHRGRTPDAVAAALAVGVATVFNVKRRYLGEGLAAALHDKPRSGKPARIDGVARAKITALACAAAPEGHARWTLRLLADKAVELGFVGASSHNTVTALSPYQLEDYRRGVGCGLTRVPQVTDAPTRGDSPAEESALLARPELRFAVVLPRAHGIEAAPVQVECAHDVLPAVGQLVDAQLPESPGSDPVRVRCE